MDLTNRRVPAALIAIALTGAGCAGAASPGWTYAHASSAPAAASAGAPSTSPAASPSGPAGSSGPSASGAPAGEVVRIAAKNIAFDQSQLSVPADRPFSLVFDNQDQGVPHNVAIYTDASAGQSLFIGEIFPGLGERTYAVPALPAGSYFYRCDVHPTQMTGTLLVK